jgi:hypothetical protein
MSGKKSSGGGGGGGAAGAGGGGGRALPPSLAGTNLDSDALRAALAGVELVYPFPQGPDKNGDHCWSQLDARTFSVRGPAYLTDRVKQPAPPALFDLMHMEIFRSNEKIGNVAARKDSWLRAARAGGDGRYYLVVLYVTPAAPYIHLTHYFAVQPEAVAAAPHFAKLWEQFTAHGPAANAFRDERWKVIPRVAEGSWIVSNAVGTKPALLATKLTHTWILCDGTSAAQAAAEEAADAAAVPAADAGCSTAPGRARGGSLSAPSGPGPYLEADCDVASSNMAFVLVSLLQSYAR